MSRLISKTLALAALIMLSAGPTMAYSDQRRDPAYATAESPSLIESPSPMVSKSPTADRSATDRSTINSTRPEAAKREEVKAKAVARLDAAKLKICQNREKAIQKRSTQLTRMAEKMLNVFSNHAARVQNYYTARVAPSGRTVENYDGLVTEIATQKSAAQTALATAQAAMEDFSCASEDPKGQLKGFNEQMKIVKQALKDYRTAIRNLIVAVRGNDGAPKAKASLPATAAATALPSASLAE